MLSALPLASARLRPKFHLAQLDTTRHVLLCQAGGDERVKRDECVERCFSNMADDEEAVVLASTSLMCCPLSVHVNKTEKRQHAVWMKDYLKRDTFVCYNSLLMSDLMNHKAIWSNYMRIDIELFEELLNLIAEL